MTDLGGQEVNSGAALILFENRFEVLVLAEEATDPPVLLI